MRPGSLGEMIAPNGHVGDLYWREVGATTEVYEIVETNTGFATVVLAAFYGPQDTRLERVAVFLSYLQDEATAAVETV